MPILLKPNESDPLSQGDVLVGLRLYSTSANWDDSELPGGPPEWEDRYGLCLVVSRPCVIAHKGSILVAAVHAVREAPPVPRDAGYEEVKLFLMKLRDGAGRPDRFYLGGVPGQPSGRY